MERGSWSLGKRPRWLRSLVRRLIRQHEPLPRPRLEDVVQTILDSETFNREHTRSGAYPKILQWRPKPNRMEIVEGPPSTFPIATLNSDLELSQWLGLSLSDLDWFSDRQGRHRSSRKSAKLRHYHFHWLEKRCGGYRLLETPKPLLRSLQRRLHDHILLKVPPSPQAHGFVPERSVTTYVSPHVGKAVVIRMDLENFFWGIGGGRVYKIFRRIGYEKKVASHLAGLCTIETPEDVLLAIPNSVSSQERFSMRADLRRGHLPQGAPSSPMLSNLATLTLDRRLHGLAKSYQASYTRYADDLAFSSDSPSLGSNLKWMGLVGMICREEGFRLRHRKTRVMPSSTRQELGGLVINEKANIRRRDYDRLRALLHNGIKHGAGAQNREKHPHFRESIAGKISWVAATHPSRGQALKELFDQVDWNPSAP